MNLFDKPRSGFQESWYVKDGIAPVGWKETKTNNYILQRIHENRYYLEPQIY